jgi:hypothetical protein
MKRDAAEDGLQVGGVAEDHVIKCDAFAEEWPGCWDPRKMTRRL